MSNKSLVLFLSFASALVLLGACTLVGDDSQDGQSTAEELKRKRCKGKHECDTDKPDASVDAQGDDNDAQGAAPDAEAPDATPPPPPDASAPPVCDAFTYSEFGPCQPNNTQTRTVVSATPAGCMGGAPVLSQACVYVPPVEPCTSYTYSDFGPCQPNNTQTRTVASSSPAGCTGGATPVLSQACVYVPPTCMSFTYSAFGACQPNNTQMRTVVSSAPAGCTGGTPVLTQACTYVPPIDGAALYSQYCASCHGNSKKGRPAATIQSAINLDVGGMSILNFLTPAQILAISQAP